MKTIKHFPLHEDLQLPLSIYQALIDKLTEPFNGSIQVTSDYWDDYGCSITICDEDARVQELLIETSKHHTIQRGLDNPDLIEDLPEGYQLRLVIQSDEGSGFYLLVPPPSNESIP